MLSLKHYYMEATFSRLYLYRHGPQVGTEEEEPHQLIGLYGHQVVDLPQRHLAHRHVGGGQTQHFVVNHRLETETATCSITFEAEPTGVFHSVLLTV